jgi:iron complex outermembrane receptor protein
MDSTRVRITESGLGTADVSGASPDHRVAADTLNARQVDVLRGPSTLLYGSGAIGGLVNIVSDRVPRQRAGQAGVGATLRGAGADRERAAALDLDAPIGQSAALRLEGSAQRTGNYRLAAPLRDAQGAVLADKRLPNSATDTRSVAVGTAWFGQAQERIGGAMQRYESDYGIPNPEEPVTIRLRRTRWEIEADGRRDAGSLPGVRSKLGYTDYEHAEIAPDGSTGTRFTQRSVEGRLELPYGLAGWRGVAGLQGQRTDVRGAGEGELPATDGTAAALFAVQERRMEAWRIELGARAESERHAVQEAYADGTRAPSRRFSLLTLSAGIGWNLAPGWDLGVAINSAQRAPAAEELYFVGAHPATFAYEIGNPDLRKERSTNLDLSLKAGTGPLRAQATAFANRVRDYIYGFFDGGTTDLLDENGNVEETLSNLVFTQAQARLRGAEAEIAWGRQTGPQARLWGDTVRAALASGPNDGADLPRMSPSRLGLDLGWRQPRWSAQLAALHALRQTRVARFDLRDGEPEQPTASYTRLDAGVAWRAADRPLTLTLQVRNLTDRDIRVHTSYLKNLAPLPGRSLALTVRAAL